MMFTFCRDAWRKKRGKTRLQGSAPSWKLARDRTGRISALGLLCTDLAALGSLRPRADILPVRPSRSVNKIIYIFTFLLSYGRAKIQLNSGEKFRTHIAKPHRVYYSDLNYDPLKMDGK